MSNRVPVIGWPEYEITDCGDVYRVAQACGATVGKALKPQRLKNGYMKVSLCRASVRKEYLVHRLVYGSFVGHIPAGHDVCHNDGDRENNNLHNLRADSRAGNMADTIKHGTANRGERCGANKRAQSVVEGLLKRLIAGESVSALSAELSIPKSTLYGLRSGQTWGWLHGRNRP